MMGSIDIIVEVVVLLAAGYLAWTAHALRSLTDSYAKRKGTNLAQKEDIEELTRRVESVREEFAQDLAHLRARLDRELSRDYRLFEVELEAVEELVDASQQAALNYVDASVEALKKAGAEENKLACLQAIRVNFTDELRDANDRALQNAVSNAQYRRAVDFLWQGKKRGSQLKCALMGFLRVCLLYRTGFLAAGLRHRSESIEPWLSLMRAGNWPLGINSDGEVTIFVA